MGIENWGGLGIESGRVRVLTHGGKGATGVGQRARSTLVMAEPLSLQETRRSDLCERRRRLMDDWAGYLAGRS